MKRLLEFDGLRFVLCLGIAIFHYSFRVPVKNETLQSFILTFSYFTDIFFVVSGLFLARRRNYSWDARHYAAFVGKRLARIYPLHVAAFSCFALLSILTARGLLHPSAPPNMSWRDGLSQLLLVHNWGMGKTFSYNYVSWSLSALFLMYLAFPLFDLLCRRLGRWILVVIAMAVLGGDYLAELFGASTITRIQFANIGVFRALPSFLFGMWVARESPAWMPRWSIRLGLVACLAIFLFYHPTNGFDGSGTLEGPWRLGFLYCFTYLLYAASTQNVCTPLRWNILVKNARYSFAIFVLHPLVALFFFNALPVGWADTTMGALLLIAGCTLVTVVIAAVAWYLYENPLNRWLVARIDAWLNGSVVTAVETASPAGSA